MKPVKPVKQVVAVLVWCVVSVGWNSAFAEYQAITKFPYCQLVGGSRGCDGVTDPKKLELMLPSGVDETDIKACDAITDNINSLEKYNIDWNCDFPISGNNYLLGKPQWTEVQPDEHEKENQWGQTRLKNVE